MLLLMGSDWLSLHVCWRQWNIYIVHIFPNFECQVMFHLCTYLGLICQTRREETQQNNYLINQGSDKLRKEKKELMTLNWMLQIQSTSWHNILKRCMYMYIKQTRKDYGWVPNCYGCKKQQQRCTVTLISQLGTRLGPNISSLYKIK